MTKHDWPPKDQRATRTVVNDRALLTIESLGGTVENARRRLTTEFFKAGLRGGNAVEGILRALTLNNGLTVEQATRATIARPATLSTGETVDREAVAAVLERLVH